MADSMEALKSTLFRRVERFRSRPLKTFLPTACMGGWKPSAKIESSVRSNGTSNLNGQSKPRIQNLYHACERAFKGGNTASEESIANLRSILDELSAADVGLSDPATGAAASNQRNPSPSLIGNGWLPQRLSPASTPIITYLGIYDCKDFSVGIFCLPPSASIPLHNLPGMIVFSKVLYGSMHVRSLDWLDPMEGALGKLEAARGTAVVVKDSVVSGPCATDVLFPAHGGNIHSFHAITHTAVLDVLTPPYDPMGGRPCLYYRLPDSPPVSLPGDGRKEGLEVGQLVRLEEMVEGDALPEFETRNGAYKGPKIVAN